MGCLLSFCSQIVREGRTYSWRLYDLFLDDETKKDLRWYEDPMVSEASTDGFGLQKWVAKYSNCKFNIVTDNMQVLAMVNTGLSKNKLSVKSQKNRPLNQRSPVPSSIERFMDLGPSAFPAGFFSNCQRLSSLTIHVFEQKLPDFLGSFSVITNRSILQPGKKL